MKMAFLSKLRSMVRSKGSGVGMGSTFKIPIMTSGSHLHASPSKSSHSTHSGQGVDVAQYSYILKESLLPAIQEQLHVSHHLLLPSGRASKNEDWGFDEIWPSTNPVDQDWYWAWEERERRASMSPFGRSFEDETIRAHMDMQRIWLGKCMGTSEKG
jgi:hypothetical protein